MTILIIESIFSDQFTSISLFENPEFSDPPPFISYGCNKLINKYELPGRNICFPSGQQETLFNII